MRLLDENSVDITGFASVRERVLVQSSEFFKRPAPEHCLSGLGSFVYLANAWFTPNGQTGLHHHSGVDIVSLIPRGSIFHQGTLGEGEQVSAGTVQIQRSGLEGFSHNEMNPNNQVQPFIQMWLAPENPQPKASFELIELQQGQTELYRNSTTLVSALQWQAGGELQLEHEVLVFVYAGSATAQTAETEVELQRGMLLKAKNFKLKAMQELSALVVQHLELDIKNGIK